MRITAFILSILLLCGVTKAQEKGLKTLKDLWNAKPGELVKEMGFDKLLGSSKEEYEKSSFNYAISFSDNTALFETIEKGQRQKAVLMNYLTKDDNGENKASNANITGEVAYASNNFRLAEFSFLRAKKLYEEGDNKGLEYSQVLSNLGLLYMSIGRFSEAKTYNQEALKIREELANGSLPHAASINNIGVWNKDMGNYGEAEKLINQAIEINRKYEKEEKTALAISLNNKAMLFQALGRYEEAEKLMHECLETAAKEMGERSNNYIKLKINLAILYKEVKRYEEAEKIYLECIKIKEARYGINHPDYAHLKRGIALLYLEMGEIRKVQGHLWKAVSIYKKQLGEDHPSYAASINDLSTFYRLDDDIERAEKYGREALLTRKKVLGENHPDYLESVENYAIVKWKKDEIDSAKFLFSFLVDKTLSVIDDYFPYMSEKEKTKFWDKTRPRLYKFYSFAFQNAQTNPDLVEKSLDLQLNAKALILNSSNKTKQAILNSGDKKLIEQYSYWLTKKEYLAFLYTLSKSELEEENINLDSLEDVVNKLEKDMTIASEQFSSAYSNKDVNYKDIYNSLNTDEAYVDLIYYNYFDKIITETPKYAAIILTKDNPKPQFVSFTNSYKMDTIYFPEYRKRMQNARLDEESYTYFWKPIDERFANKKTIYVSPDGIYNMISLNTLKSGNQYLLDKYNIVMIANGKEIISMKKQKPKTLSKNATILGFPYYGDKDAIPPLPGTKKEAETLKAMLQKSGYKVNEYLQAEASEAKVKNADARILHIATHGFFFSDVSFVKADKVFGIEKSAMVNNPLHRSGLLLANAEATIYNQNTDDSGNNGILTAYETMNLNLEKTDLVVLSACETGLGDIKAGEGVYGLQRSFQIAGAKSIIMSLWQVSDDATMELMKNFYQNYLKTNNKRESLTLAQKKVKEKYPEPFYWGAFVLIGE